MTVRRHPFTSIVAEDIRECNRYAIINIFSMVVGVFTILPIRLFLLVVPSTVSWFYLKWISRDMTFPVNYCSWEKEPLWPLEKRKRAHRVMQFFHRFTLWGFGVYWINVKKRKTISDEAKICVIAPHTSLADGTCAQVLRCFTGVGALPELTRPVTGTIFKALEYVWVDYENHASRKSCVEATLQRAVLPAWKDILQTFMVEGTTHGGNALCQFKKGPFLPGQPVQAVVVELPEWIDVVLGNTGRARTRKRGAGWGGWTYNTPVWQILLYQLTVLWQPCTIHIMPVYHPSEEEKNNPTLFANNVRAQCVKYTNFDSCDMNQLDGKIVTYLSAKHPGVDASKYGIYAQKIEEQFGSKALSKVVVMEWLEEFLQHRNHRELAPVAALGLIGASKKLCSFEEFVKYKVTLKMT